MTERQTILHVCKSIRSRYVRDYQDLSGFCTEVSGRIREQLKRNGIEVKEKYGLFRIDRDSYGEYPKGYSGVYYGEPHTWIEWNKVPIDATATQFHDLVSITIPPIIFGRLLDRFLTNQGRKIYANVKG